MIDATKLKPKDILFDKHSEEIIIARCIYDWNDDYGYNYDSNLLDLNEGLDEDDIMWVFDFTYHENHLYYGSVLKLGMGCIEEDLEYATPEQIEKYSYLIV